MSDYIWDAVKPKNGNAFSIEQMNAKLLAFDPRSPAKYDIECRKIAMTVLEIENPSFAELVRRGIEHP